MKKIISSLLTAIILSHSSLVFALDEVKKEEITKNEISSEIPENENLTKKIAITQSQLVLSSKLRKEYNAYRYDIANNSNQTINIVNAQLINGVDGSIAAKSVDHGSGAGTTWLICGPLGLFTFGIGWAVGLLATPIVMVVSSNGNKKARAEGVAYSNLVNLGYLSSGESTTVQTLVPIGAKAQLRLTVQGEYDKDLIMINQ